MPTPLPDSSYHIDATSRAHLQPGIDAAALEELLQYFPSEARAFHLAMFLDTPIVADADGNVPDICMLTGIGNPVMHDLLERARGWRRRPDA